MIKINPASINDLVLLKESGFPVTLTSHPGNASLYKLVFWKCGIPEHLWDITCCKADSNNWPMHRLAHGRSELLVTEDLYRDILSLTNPERRWVTAYQFAVNGKIRLGRIHVRAMQACFPKVISSCSRLLLSEKERVYAMFDYLANTKPSKVFTRYITSRGILRPIRESDLKVKEFAASFMDVLGELDKLLFSDEEIITKGGACYDGVMVPLAGMLVQYWQTGRTDRYDISGPDMIHYALRSEHQRDMSDMLAYLRKWNAKLVPEHFVIQMFPGTVARIGHIAGHLSEEVMARKLYILQNHNSLGRDQKRQLWEMAKDDEGHWPIQINPSQDCYFSQYDLAANGGRLLVNDFWRECSIHEIRDRLFRANALLRIGQNFKV